LGQTESYLYDNNGNLQSKTDFNGHTTTYVYDEMNRLRSKTADAFFSQGACANGACGATQVTYTYTLTGKRKTMTDAGGTTTYNYDDRDRLHEKQTPFGKLTYGYDTAGNLLSMSSSNTGGAMTTFSYDKLNRLQTVTDQAALSAGASNAITTYGYDLAGNLSTAAYPNKVTTSYTYNLLNRLTKVAATTPGSTLASYQYTLGLAGNRTAVKELSGRTVNYGYDDIYRLTSETIAGATSQNGTIGYTDDAVGNRRQITSTVQAIPSSGTLFYDANDRTATDGYDNNGNTISAGGDANVYDFENHLVQHGSVSIVYDGDGNRVSETAGGETTNYLVDTLNPTGYAQVVDEIKGVHVVRSYNWGLQLISQRQVAGSQQLSYYGFDGHGSVRYLTDNTGAVTDTYDYDAFGNKIASTGSTTNNYLFAGEQFDNALNLYYNRARYLDVRSGRFWTMDPYEGEPQSPGSLHKYLYALDDPPNQIDPSGNDSLASLSVDFAIEQTLNAMPFSAVFRAGQMLYRVAHGMDLSEAAQGAALRFLEDSALTFLSAGLLRYAVGTLPLRVAGAAVARAATSIWNIASISQRGAAVEGFIFQNVLGRLRTLPYTFPVIDDFFQGVATSIKSLDLTAASYQTASGIFSKLSQYAGELAEFEGATMRSSIVRGVESDWSNEVLRPLSSLYSETTIRTNAAAKRTFLLMSTITTSFVLVYSRVVGHPKVERAVNTLAVGVF
jgi:RHS repeat-associated protein